MEDVAITGAVRRRGRRRVRVAPVVGRFHLFRVEITSVDHVRYEQPSGDQYVVRWPAGQRVRPAHDLGHQRRAARAGPRRPGRRDADLTAALWRALSWAARRPRRPRPASSGRTSDDDLDQRAGRVRVRRRARGGAPRRGRRGSSADSVTSVTNQPSFATSRQLAPRSVSTRSRLASACRVWAARSPAPTTRAVRRPAPPGRRRTRSGRA